MPGKPTMPFDSAKQEAYLWAKEPAVAKEKYDAHGHAPGWKDYHKKKVVPKSKKKKKKYNREAGDMSQREFTPEEIRAEAIAALNEGDERMAANLFKASLMVKAATTVCESCGNPMKMIKISCGCGTRNSTICESCMKRQGGICETCGKPLRIVPVASNEPSGKTRNAATLTYKKK